MHVQSRHFPSAESTPADDKELVEQVAIGLQRRFGNEVRHFQMSAREDGLVLRGVVKTYYGKQLVQEVAMEVSGLPILANEIKVQSSAVTQRGEAAAK